MNEQKEYFLEQLDECTNKYKDCLRKASEYVDASINAARMYEKAKNDSIKWHPIETAPIGEYVLVFFSNHKKHIKVAKLTKGREPRWKYCGNGGWSEPTHWMPLPDKPE